MKFLLLSENWQEKATEYYRDSLSTESEAAFFDNVLEHGEKEKTNKKQNQMGQIETAQKNEQLTFSAFFGIKKNKKN